MSVERNTFVNTKSGIDRKAYNKQRNVCLSLIRSEKLFSNVNTSNISGKKTFGRQ